MTKLTFANKNVIVIEGYKIGDALPAKAPTLKTAAIMTVKEIENNITLNSSVVKTKINGEFKDLFFNNGAILTVPSEYSPEDYLQTLKIVVKEIDD